MLTLKNNSHSNCNCDNKISSDTDRGSNSNSKNTNKKNNIINDNNNSLENEYAKQAFLKTSPDTSQNIHLPKNSSVKRKY